MASINFRRSRSTVAAPAASQSTGTTVVLAHLSLDLQPSPKPDVNTPADVGASDRRAGDDEAIPEDEEETVEGEI